MIDPKASGMKGLPFEALQGRDQFGACALWQAGPAAIDGVPDQRMTDMGHVYPDLMSSTGLELNFDQGVRRKPFMNAVVGDGGLAVRADRKALAIGAMATDGKINGATPGQGPLNQG